MALAVSFGLLVARLLAPTEFAAEIAYIGAPALAVVALAARSFRSRGRGATPWLLLTLGVGCLLAAEVSWFAADLTDTEGFPAAGEYLNAAALLVVVFALWRTVIRVAPIGDRTGIIDSTAVALAAGTLGWLLVIEPAAANAELDADAQTWITILLALDVALLAVVTRLGFSLRVRPPGPNPLRHHRRPHDDVTPGDDREVAAEGVLDARRQDQRPRHLHEDDEAVRNVVVVVGGGEPGEVHPRPPDGEEDHQVAEDRFRDMVLGQPVMELRGGIGDRHHEQSEHMEAVRVLIETRTPSCP